ncbi:FAS-like protein, partial [Mya arenaria]
MTEGSGMDEVVISGISCRLPGCDNILEFKEKLFRRGGSPQQVMLEWKGNWTLFLDLLLQTKIVQENSRALKIPRMLSFLEISPQNTGLKSEESEIVPAQVNVVAKTIQSKGVVLGNTQVATINRRKEAQSPTLMSYSFRPYIGKQTESTI